MRIHVIIVPTYGINLKRKHHPLYPASLSLLIETAIKGHKSPNVPIAQTSINAIADGPYSMSARNAMTGNPKTMST